MLQPRTLMNGSTALAVMLLATVMLLSCTERHLVKASTSAISPSPTVTAIVTVGSNQTYVPTSSAVVQITSSGNNDDAKDEDKEKNKIALIVGGCAGSFVVIVGITVVVCCHRKENQD